jgi:hypothetical protein
VQRREFIKYGVAAGAVVLLGGYQLIAPAGHFEYEGEYGTFIWDRALSTEEMQAVMDNPWQMFEAKDASGL